MKAALYTVTECTGPRTLPVQHKAKCLNAYTNNSWRILFLAVFRRLYLAGTYTNVLDMAGVAPDLSSSRGIVSDSSPDLRDCFAGAPSSAGKVFKKSSNEKCPQTHANVRTHAHTHTHTPVGSESFSSQFDFCSSIPSIEFDLL